MGGTAPSLLVFFSSTNPHYLLAKPDSKGLSTANLPPSCSSGNVRPNLAVPIPYTGIPPKQTLKWWDDSIHLIEYFMPGLSSEWHINIVWINFVHLVFTIYLSRYHPTPTPNFCVWKNSWAKLHNHCIHQTQVRSLSTLVSNSLTYQTKPTKPSSWSQTYQTKFTPKT